MRGLFLLAALACGLTAACGPKVDPNSPFDHSTETGEEVVVVVEELPEAPPGPGLRVLEVDADSWRDNLAGGPSSFLQLVEVAAAVEASRFVGWRLVQLMGEAATLRTLDLQPGDVLLSVNGSTLSKPDQLMTLWTSLAKATRIVAKLQRGDGQFTIEVNVVPAPALAVTTTAKR